MGKQTDTKIHLYLVHGTLGSGKTSFIQNLSQSEYFKNSYIIENEFANQNVDKSVLSEHFKIEDIFDISGGCVCCSTGNELILALNNISKVNIHKFPVILETTGVANSVQLLKKLILNNDFNSKFQLVKNILIIDLLENNVQSLQNKVLDIILADTIVLNKVDLVDEHTSEQMRKFIKNIHSEATIFTSIKGNIHINDFVHSNVRAENVITKNFDSVVNFTEVNHEDDVTYEILLLDKPIEKQDCESKVRDLLKNYHILRIKGYFKDSLEKTWHIQATKNNIEITPASGTISKASVVVIGKDITNIKL